MFYIVIILFLVMLMLIYDFGAYRTNRDLMYNFVLLIFISVAGFRWYVGGDSFTYQNVFESAVGTLSGFTLARLVEFKYEPGFVLFMTLSKTLFREFWFFQVLHAVVVNVILFKFFKRYSNVPFTCLVLYAFFYYFYFNMEILREILAICIFIQWMYPALVKNKLKAYYLLNILALFFHTSAVILLILPFLSRFRLNFKCILALLFMMFAVIGTFSIFPDAVNLLSFSERLSEKFDTYHKYSLNINGIIYNFFCFVIFPFYVIRLQSKYFNEVNFKELIFPFFFVIALFLSYSGAGRFINYFGPFMIVFFANSISIVAKVSRFKNVKILIISLMLLVTSLYKCQYYFNDTSRFYKNTKKINLWYPYSSIFNREEYPFRKVIFEEGMRESINQE